MERRKIDVSIDGFTSQRPFIFERASENSCLRDSCMDLRLRVRFLSRFFNATQFCRAQFAVFNCMCKLEGDLSANYRRNIVRFSNMFETWRKFAGFRKKTYSDVALKSHCNRSWFTFAIWSRSFAREKLQRSAAKVARVNGPFNDVKWLEGLLCLTSCDWLWRWCGSWPEGCSTQTRQMDHGHDLAQLSRA